MNATTLGTLARTVDGALFGTDAGFAGVGTDTRKNVKGQLFVALSGPNFDGHDFVVAAARAGAAGALVVRRVETDLPQVVVDDTRTALARYACAWRMQFDIPVVGVTGSNGKTTVKQMVAAILGERGPVLATRGNLNNEIGVPLTLLDLEQSHHAAVIEMGANHGGEIATLAGIARPDIGVVTNAAAAHLEGFGDLDGVARAKGELFAALPAEGTAVINADDPYSDRWHETASHCRRVTFAVEADADFRAHDVAVAPRARFTLVAPGGEREIVLPVAGRHNIANALAGAAAAVAAGANLTDVAAGLARFESAPGRLRVRAGIAGETVIDDTYNANPASLDAALAVLAAAGGRRWLVLGDMLELGARARDAHADAGRRARESGVERLYATGAMAEAVVAGFGEGAETFDDPTELVERMGGSLSADLTVLVKGSRGMRMERVVAALTAQDGG